MWEGGVCLSIKATTGQVIVGNLNGVWLKRTVQRKTAEQRWERTNFEMVVAVPWRKHEDDATLDGERLKQEDVRDRDHKEKTGDGRTCSGTEETVCT